MAFVAAVDFGGTKVAAATATASGEIVDRVRLDTRAPEGADQAVARAIDATRTLIARTESATGEPCAGAGIVCPGLPLADRVALAPNIPGWEDLGLERVMRDGLQIEPVVVGNDVRAAGLAELRWGALAGADPALFINLGTGVAAAVLVGGRIMFGAHEAAGEIGHTLRGADADRGFAAGAAPLEEHAGGRFIGLRAGELTGRELTTAQAFADLDPGVRELVDRTLDELAVHVANQALLIDPGRIAVGGGLMGSAERVLGALRRRLDSALPFPPELVSARFADDGALHGALALILDRMGSEPKPTSVPTTTDGTRR